MESFRYRLNLPLYGCKAEAPIRLAPDPNVVTRFHHKMVELDPLHTEISAIDESKTKQLSHTY